MQTVSVSQLTNYISHKLKTDALLKSLSVRGEVSNFSMSGSNAYFDLKDEDALISCVYFGFGDIPLIDGQEVQAMGRIDLYAKGGRYNLIVSSIVHMGIGELMLRFEQLKKQLSAKGMFAQEIKKPIPALAIKVGIVTSPTGAALQDMLRVAQDRYAHIYVYPSKVQGYGAGAELAAGVRALEALGVDVIIVARGGGSYEDLFEFNDKELIYAIYECSTPVVSGVGHEVDFTLCDFVSDVRAATPTQAAQMVFLQKDVLIESQRAVAARIANKVSMLLYDAKHTKSLYTMDIQSNSPKAVIIRTKAQTQNYKTNIYSCMSARIAQMKSSRELYTARIRMNDVQYTLKKGYALVQKNGRYIKQISEIEAHDKLTLKMADGKLDITAGEKYEQ